MARYINGSWCPNNSVITEDHEGVQIRTQWDTGIKSCQMSVRCTDAQYFPFYFLLLLLFCIIKIKYIMHDVQDYYILYNNVVCRDICSGWHFIRVCSHIIFLLAIVLSVLCFTIFDILLVYSYISLYKSSKQMILVLFF